MRSLVFNFLFVLAVTLYGFYSTFTNSEDSPTLDKTEKNAPKRQQEA